MPLFPSSWDQPYPGSEQPSDGVHRVTRNEPARDRSAAVPPPAEVLGTVLDEAGSPRQQEIARHIYARLKQGAGVDDVTDLIGELRQVATEQTQRSVFGGRSSGRGDTYRPYDRGNR